MYVLTTIGEAAAVRTAIAALARSSALQTELQSAGFQLSDASLVSINSSLVRSKAAKGITALVASADMSRRHQASVIAHVHTKHLWLDCSQGDNVPRPTAAAAQALAPAPMQSSSSSNGSSSGSSGGSSASVGAIVGGVVGGLAALLLIGELYDL